MSLSSLGDGTSVLDKSKRLSNSTIGWCQFIRSPEKYIDSYMMNENFVSWGCEDDEFYFPYEYTWAIVLQELITMFII